MVGAAVEVMVVVSCTPTLTGSGLGPLPACCTAHEGGAAGSVPVLTLQNAELRVAVALWTHPLTVGHGGRDTASHPCGQNVAVVKRLQLIYRQTCRGFDQKDIRKVLYKLALFIVHNYYTL